MNRRENIMKITEEMIDEMDVVACGVEMALDMSQLIFHDLYVNDKINTATRAEKRRYAPILLAVMCKLEDQKKNAKKLEKDLKELKNEMEREENAKSNRRTRYASSVAPAGEAKKL